MRRTPIIFLLLLAMAFGLSAGPHPCHVTEGAHSAPKVQAGAEHASCHGKPAAPATPSKEKKEGGDCCDPAKGGHALCDPACQSTAVLIVAPAAPTAVAFQELAEPVLEGPVTPFAFPIDHVPLS